MTTEMQVLEWLKDAVNGRISLFVDGPADGLLDENSVIIDSPDPDSMRCDDMVYIQPDYASYQSLTTSSDEVTLEAKVFFLCKGADSETLVRRVFGLFTAFHSMLGSDPTLGSVVDSSRITDMDYYPAVSGSQSIVAIEAKVELKWERSF